MSMQRMTSRQARKELERTIPIAQAFSSVVNKRAANNNRKGKTSGFKAHVTDNDPMDKDSESNYP